MIDHFRARFNQSLSDRKYVLLLVIMAVTAVLMWYLPDTHDLSWTIVMLLLGLEWFLIQRQRLLTLSFYHGMAAGLPGFNYGVLCLFAIHQWWPRIFVPASLYLLLLKIAVVLTVILIIVSIFKQHVYLPRS